MTLTTVFRSAARKPLPKFWRPRLDAGQKLACRTIHWDLLTRFTDGSADCEALWDWMETGLTYHQFMRYLDADGTAFTVEAMEAVTEQLAIYEGVVARFARTGRVGFDAEQLLVARAAAQVFDSLLDLDRNGYAEQAARWSCAQMEKIWGGVR